MKKSLIALFASVILSASGAASAGVWMTPDTLRVVYPAIGNNIFIAVDTAANRIDPDGCGNPGYVILDATSLRFKEHYQAVLTALAADKKIRFYINGCIGAYPKMTHIQLFRS